jgi:hypothetical protein
MISAKAKMEHKMSGQMGHPAAWMMDNKTVPSGALKMTKACDYGRIVGVRAHLTVAQGCSHDWPASLWITL